jgi:PKD repeat protein
MHSDTGGPPAPGTPTADFSASVLSGAAPLSVDFTDLSSDTPTIWSWSFGDAGSGSTQNPSHRYTTAGTYRESLTASNASGSHTRVFPDLITVPEPGAMVQLGSGIALLLVLSRRRAGARQL